MKNVTGTLLLVVLTMSSFALAYYQLTERTIDSDYVMKFSTRSTDGTFSGLEGTVIFSPLELENASINVKLDASTIETGNDKKNEHANSEDWLDTKKYPEIRFTSSKFQKQDDKYTVVGTMNLHGIEKAVQIPFNYNEESGEFTGSFTVNRSDYGITGAGLKAIFVGEEIEISFNIPTSIKQ